MYVSSLFGRQGVIVDEKGRRFTRRNEDTDLVTFIADWYEGRMRPFIRSLKIPKNQEKKVVKEVVGRTFDEIVMDPTKDTLIQFYERDCGYCAASGNACTFTLLEGVRLVLPSLCFNKFIFQFVLVLLSFRAGGYCSLHVLHAPCELPGRAPC